MMMRFDPFRDLDRLFDTASGGVAAGPRPLPMNAVRRGDKLHVSFDVPGVRSEDIDLTVERNQLVLTVERRLGEEHEGEQWLVRERPIGRFTRQIVLGDNLDTGQLEANYTDGVLELSIPVAEEAKPRKVSINAAGSNGGQNEAIEATSKESQHH
jgi:HSP20 family protein